MATKTTSTTGKTGKTTKPATYTLADAKTAWDEAVAKHAEKTASADTALRVAKAHIVAKAVNVGRFTKAEVSRTLGISEGEVGKLHAAGTVATFGCDVLATFDAIADTASGVTVGTIGKVAKDVAAGKVSKADAFDALTAQGIPAKSKRGARAAGGKTPTDRVASIRKTVDGWLTAAEKGRIGAADLYTILQDAADQLADSK